MPTPDWTPEAEELVARELYAFAAGNPDVVDVVLPGYDKDDQDVRNTCREGAHRFLTVLAAEGLLCPHGGDTREEWGTRVWRDGDKPEDGMVYRRGSRHDAETTVSVHAWKLAAGHAPPWEGNACMVRRTVHTGPWCEVTDPAGDQP